MPPIFGPLAHRRASDSVYEVLRNAILSQTFRPGERLNVHELASQLGVSLTPVKEAINRLAAEDLIEIRPRSGTFVTALSPEEVAETFELRAALECLAAEKVVGHASEADLARLRRLVTEMAEPAADEAARLRHEGLNLEFHNLIVSLSRNTRLVQMYESLNAHIQIARIHRGAGDWEIRIAGEHDEHEAIVDALERRDTAATVHALRRHIMRASDSLVRDLQKAAMAGSNQMSEPVGQTA